MKQEELISRIRQLQAINPNASFASNARLAILKSSEPKQVGLIWSPQNIISQTLNASFSMILTAFFLIIVLGSMNGSLKGALVSAILGVDGGLLSEASAVSKDIDVRLDEAKYSASLATRAKAALKEVATGGPDHLNPAILKSETDGLNAYGDVNQNVDELLNKATE